MLEPSSSEVIWIVVVAFLVALILSIAMGANDVANSFGTSVGSGVITLRQCFVLASIFEISGSILLGSEVAKTIKSGIINVTMYNETEKVLMVGNIAAISGSAIWQLVATALKLPVSGTHSIVGGILGFGLVQHQLKGIQFMKLLKIVVSWFVSPLLAGVVAILWFAFIKYFVLLAPLQCRPFKRDFFGRDALSAGLMFLPLFYGITVFFNTLSIFLSAPPTLKLNQIPVYGRIILSIGIAFLITVMIRLILVPIQRRRILKALEVPDEEPIAPEEDDVEEKLEVIKERRRSSVIAERAEGRERKPSVVESIAHKVRTLSTGSSPVIEENEEEEEERKEEKDLETTVVFPGVDINSNETDLSQDPPEIRQLFKFLQILTACFGSFAHGGNDVSNAIGPLLAIWAIYKEGNIAMEGDSPVWILLYGGVGISLGLILLGKRVMETMGKDLTPITPSSGFTIEIASAMTVLIASNVGIPVSSTHCKVGAIVFIGRYRAKEAVDWSLFYKILAAWFVTVPASAAVSAAIFACLRLAV